MSIAKKGSRKITVAEVDYQWRVSRPRRISDWRDECDLLDEVYCKIAAQYGPGQVADVVFNIPIELYREPKSKILAKYFGIIIDGFLGIEQVAQIKPGLVADIIRESLRNGWNPAAKDDYMVEIFERKPFKGSTEKLRPAVIVMPGINEASMLEYDNLIRLVEVS